MYIARIKRGFTVTKKKFDNKQDAVAWLIRWRLACLTNIRKLS